MTQRERQWQPVRLGNDVPPPVGAYSPAARAGGFVFVSGQVPRDPVTGALVGDDVESQTTQVIAVIVYLADIDDWGRFNVKYKELMPTPYPTRTALGANLRGIFVEISAVAYVGS